MSLVHIQNSQIKYRTKRCFSDFLIVKLKSFTFHIRPEIAFRNFRFFNQLYDFGFQGNNILRSEEHTSELQSRPHLVCRLLLDEKKKRGSHTTPYRCYAGRARRGRRWPRRKPCSSPRSAHWHLLGPRSVAS